MTAAEGLDVESIAFVAMGIGIYRWPVEVAAQIAVGQLALSKALKKSIYVTSQLVKTTYLEALTSKITGH